MSEERRGYAGILETALYYDAAEGEAVERFYAEILGLREVSRWPGGTAFRLGAGSGASAGVLLLFEREATASREGPIAAHGSSGPGHVCLLAPDSATYEHRKRELAAAGIEITHEEHWGDGVRSFYFADPAGNLIEIAEADIWPP